ncbi:MAG: PD-(D/E)XK nuclease family protein, partial [Acidobacteria bacterium]|nr:PD-(D/E)XK nuclease family protein [Acidobacteriota bacterium]
IATENLSGLRRLAEGHVVQDGPARSAEEVWQRALDLRPGLLSRATRERPSLGLALARSAARRSPLFTAYEGRLGRAPSRGPLDRQVSASRLELFAGCPYRLFLEKVLGLAEREETEEAFEADNLAKGNLLHDALASLASGIPKGRSLTRLAEPAQLSKEHAARAAARWSERAGAARPPLFVELAANEVARGVHAVLDYESSRAHPDRIPVAGAEVRFGAPFSAGDAAEDPALSSDAPLLVAGVAIGGRMDRLDFDKGGTRGLARVVDYKWSRNLTPFGGRDPGGRLVAGGERLQLAVYARAARAHGATEVVSEYLFVRPREKTEDFEVVAVVFSAEETRRAEALLEDAIRALSSASRDGLFLPRTQSARQPKDACRYCSMARVCGPTKKSVYRRKLRGDERGLGALAELWALP